MTKRETATRCRIHYEKYEKIEQCQEELTIGILDALSEGLGVNIFEYLGIDVFQIPQFSCIESGFITEDQVEIATWGIEVCCKTTSNPSKCNVFTFYYPDLTTEKEELLRLIDLMNREQLQLIHVEDVIEDYLS
jgi:hypothetical protein